jgi:O-antigen/teichoic acid export membrane protein
MGAIAAVCCWLFFFYSDSYSAEQLGLIGLGLAGIPFLSSTQMLSAILRGHHKIYQSQLAEKLIRPLTFVLLILTVSYVLEFTVFYAVIAALAALGLAFGFNLMSSLSAAKNHSNGSFKVRHLFVGGFFFVLLNSVSVLNSRVDIIMLGWLGSLNDVGTYNIAVRLSDILGFSLVLAYTLFAPKVAAYFKEDETQNLQKLATFAARAVSLVSLPIFAVYIFFGKEILGLFGEGYTVGYSSMLMVSLAQLISCFTGLAGTILLMTSGERFAFYAQVTALALNTTLNFLLIPTYGSNGAAFSTMTSIIIWNILMWYFSKKHVNVDSSFL